MKILEMKATRPEAKPNAKFVINTDKIEQVGINGSTIEVSTGGDYPYHEYYSSVEEAEHRYDEILLQLAAAHEPAVLYEDCEPAIVEQPNGELKHVTQSVDTPHKPTDYSIHAGPDEIEVATNTTIFNYPIGPDKCLLNVQAAFKELASDIYREIYKYYEPSMPVGTVAQSRHISLESDDERITKIIRNAIRLSNDRTCPSQILVYYAGHVNLFEIEIYVNGWVSGSEPDFKFSAPGDPYAYYAQTTPLQSLIEVEWVLRQLDRYAQADPSGKYLSRLRAALFEVRPQLMIEENSKSKS